MALIHFGEIQMELLGRPLTRAPIPAVGQNNTADVGE
jgi:hypothetical protein